jgi:hypothetical protein
VVTQTRRSFLERAAIYSSGLLIAGCAGHIPHAVTSAPTNARGKSRAPRAIGSGPGWSFNVTSNGDGSTYTVNGATYTVHVTDSFGSWQLVDPSGNVVLSNTSSDGTTYVLSNSAATATVNYNNLTLGATVPVANQSMTLASANQVYGSDGSSLTVNNNGTASASFTSSVPAETLTTVVGYPGGGNATGSGGGTRNVLSAAACRWALADLGLAQAALILAALTLETGLGVAAFLLAYAAAASAAIHVKREC